MRWGRLSSPRVRTAIFYAEKRRLARVKASEKPQQLILVGNQNNMQQQTSFLYQRSYSGSTRKWLCSATGVSKVRMRLPCHATLTSGLEAQLPSNYNATGSLNSPPGSGTFSQFSKSGSNTIAVDVTKPFVDTDVLAGVSLTAGSSFDHRVWADTGSVIGIPRAARGNVAYDKGVYSATTSPDYTAGGGPGTARSAAGFTPLILGIADTPVHQILGIGDSKMFGNNGTIDNTSNTSWCDKLYNGVLPFYNLGFSGRRADSLAIAGRMARELAYLQGIGFTHLLLEVGVNDIIAGGSVADNLPTNLLAIVAQVQAVFPGIIPIFTTITPLIETTSDFTTLVGQTYRNAGGLETKRVAQNTWVRGSGFLYYEFEHATGDDADYTRYNTAGGAHSDDGLHETTLGHTDAAARLVAKRQLIHGV